MNSNDINSIINNLCDKLGTTASKLIPEMAGYQIARYSIWMFVSLIFGVALSNLIGWHLAPHAMTVTWILNQLGGGQ